jgi:hypothetical protein
MHFVTVILSKSASLIQILTKSVAPEPEGSSPHSRETAKDPHPEPDKSTPPPNQSHQGPF